jgi:hypothetical protein
MKSDCGFATGSGFAGAACGSAIAVLLAGPVADLTTRGDEM